MQHNDTTIQIAGLQKLTLLDYPGKLSCIIFTAGCNFRCPFCHNAGIVLKTQSPVPQSEIFDFLEKRKNVLEGVCVTGGEPLIHDGIEEFLKKIKALGLSVKLDTNGSFPDKLAALIDKGLIDYVAMDVKNTPEKYGLTTGCAADYIKIEQSVKIIKESGLDYEFRTTVAKEFHSLMDMEKIGKAFAGAKKFYLQNFVVSDNLLGGVALTPFSEEEMENALVIIKKYIPSADKR